ncbi:hypothetical protein QTP88_013113 [Uroleucon formosanum]
MSDVDNFSPRWWWCACIQARGCDKDGDIRRKEEEEEEVEVEEEGEEAACLGQRLSTRVVGVTCTGMRANDGGVLYYIHNIIMRVSRSRHVGLCRRAAATVRRSFFPTTVRPPQNADIRVRAPHHNARTWSVL